MPPLGARFLRSTSRDLQNKAITTFTFSGSNQTKAEKMRALREDARRFKSSVENEIRDNKKAVPLPEGKDNSKTDKVSVPRDFPKTKIITASKPAVI